jgi:acetyl-CoA carboxylase biotin carboxyl carrier protein
VDLKARVDELAGLMKEFALEEGELKGEGWRVALKRATRTNGAASIPSTESGEFAEMPIEQPTLQVPATAVVEEKPKGTPVNSPMTGIYYTAASPSAPPFVKEGEVVEAGQVVGLIEAMKVFNEIVAPIAGTVTEITAENGALVQPGEALLYIA